MREADGDSWQTPAGGGGRRASGRGTQRMNNVFADIFKVVSFMEPNKKLFKMSCNMQ